MGGQNCDSEYFVVRIRCMNKIMKVQERDNKRKKWNRERLEDAVVNQTFKYGTIRRLVRQAE